jgi:hypothetical protein
VSDIPRIERGSLLDVSTHGPNVAVVKAHKWNKVLEAHRSGDREAFKEAFNDHANYVTKHPAGTQPPPIAQKEN